MGFKEQSRDVRMEDVVTIEEEKITSHLSPRCPQADQVVGESKKRVIDDMNRHVTYFDSTDLCTYRIKTEAGDDRDMVDSDCSKTEELMLENGV